MQLHFSHIPQGVIYSEILNVNPNITNTVALQYDVHHSKAINSLGFVEIRAKNPPLNYIININNRLI